MQVGIEPQMPLAAHVQCDRRLPHGEHEGLDVPVVQKAVWLRVPDAVLVWLLQVFQSPPRARRANEALLVQQPVPCAVLHQPVPLAMGGELGEDVPHVGELGELRMLPHWRELMCRR